jgi:hypothetical protein
MIMISWINRSDESLEGSGDNEDIIWRPDSSALAVKVRTLYFYFNFMEFNLLNPI